MKISIQLTLEEILALVEKAEFPPVKAGEKTGGNGGSFSLNPENWGGK